MIEYNDMLGIDSDEDNGIFKEYNRLQINA